MQRKYQLIYIDCGNFRTIDQVEMGTNTHDFGTIADIVVTTEDPTGVYWGYTSYVDGSLKKDKLNFGEWHQLCPRGYYGTVIDDSPDTIKRAMRNLRELIIEHPIEVLPTRVIKAMAERMLQSAP